MKVLLFGFGSSPLFLKPLVERVRKTNAEIDFSIILSSAHHLELMLEVISSEKSLCLNPLLPLYKNKEPQLDGLKNYPDNIYANIESQKVTMKNRHSEEQINLAYWSYALLKDFIKKINPDYILYTQPPENMEGMLIGGIANELNIPLAVPHHTRQLGQSFFSFDLQEILPSYSNPSDYERNKARVFLAKYRDGGCSPEPCLNFDSGRRDISYDKKRKFARLKAGFNRFYSESRSRELGTLRISLLNNWFPLWRDFYRGSRKFFNKRLYNCNAIDGLPERFIFYPIQYSPESSINIPSPYFIDQLRVIDAIRMSMPSDFTLVVKEHPACISVRPRKFMESLLHKAGVVVAKYDMDSSAIIKQSNLVISVTGTAALEAFLFGRRSLVMGPVFFSEWLGGICKIDELPNRIRDTLDSQVDEPEIIDCLSQVFAVSAEFIGRSPGEGSDSMMTYENLDLFWSTFIHHTINTNNEEKK